MVKIIQLGALTEQSLTPEQNNEGEESPNSVCGCTPGSGFYEAFEPVNLEFRPFLMRLTGSKHLISPLTALFSKQNHYKPVH